MNITLTQEEWTTVLAALSLAKYYEDAPAIKMKIYTNLALQSEGTVFEGESHKSQQIAA